MRDLILFLLLVLALGARGQQPAAVAAPEGSNWQHLQALPVGTSINVKARVGSVNCKLKSVDADTLTCTQKKDVVFQRGEILTIKIPHRGRSTLIGTGIGAAVGAGIGFAAGTSKGDPLFGPNFLRGAVTAVFATIGGAAGAVTGAATDFSRSTVYKAP
jgi:hypothetical protein